MWGRAGSNSECWLDAAQKPSLWLVCSESLIRVSARRKDRALPTGHRQTEGVLSMMCTHTYMHAWMVCTTLNVPSRLRREEGEPQENGAPEREVTEGQGRHFLLSPAQSSITFPVLYTEKWRRPSV